MKSYVVLLVLRTANIILEQLVFAVYVLLYSFIQVPKANLPEGKLVECCHCGCRGCASGDGGKKVFIDEIE